MVRCEDPKPFQWIPGNTDAVHQANAKMVEAAAADYARKVMSGKIPANRWIKAAVKRDLDDRKHGKKRGLRFNILRAYKAVRFVSLLKHSKGRDFAGKPFILSNWQVWATSVLFGWERQNESGQWVRRFNTAYSEVARKNGKSTWAAAIGLYLFYADGEPGAEVYVAATKRDQAKIVHSEAVRMVKASTAIKKDVEIRRDNLSVESTYSKFEPLGADADSTDGLNISGAIVDELHAHKNREMWDVLETATGSRSQPLVFAITTAGTDEFSLCGSVRKYAQDILTDVFSADTWFVLIFTLDEDDDYLDEKVWIKANPNLGVSVNVDDLRRKVQTAKDMPIARNATLRLHFNIWTKQKDLAIDMEHWNACSDAVDAEKLKGRMCFAGLDLAKTSDLTAYVMLFPPDNENERWQIVPHFWTTEQAVEVRTGQDRDHFQFWIDQGLIEQHDGNVIDFSLVEEKIIKLNEDYPAVIAYDPWNATQVAQNLQRIGLQAKEFRQGIMNFNEPTKTLLDMVKRREFAHGGNTVMKWMASNLEVKTDANGNLRPVKPDMRKTMARIDGMVALIMALGLSISERAEQLDFRVI